VQIFNDAAVMSFGESGRGRCKVGKGKVSLGDFGDMFEFSIFDFHSKSTIFGNEIINSGIYCKK
jgi:hypothetical protein